MYNWDKPFTNRWIHLFGFLIWNDLGQFHWALKTWPLLNNRWDDWDDGQIFRTLFKTWRWPSKRNSKDDHLRWIHRALISHQIYDQKMIFMLGCSCLHFWLAYVESNPIVKNFNHPAYCLDRYNTNTKIHRPVHTFIDT